MTTALADLIDELEGRGRSNFSLEDLRELRKTSLPALRAALHRLQMKGKIASPHRGFFSIVPPGYRMWGCLPAEQFVPDLMGHLKVDHYAGLLSAAEYHGAAHQRPQVFQVVTARSMRSIMCGKIAVDFVLKKDAKMTPTQLWTTGTGMLTISTPEATALDLVGYVHHCGGLNNVATVLSELQEMIDPGRLVVAAKLAPIAWAQRVGYLMDMVGAKKKTGDLASHVETRVPVGTPLAPGRSVRGAEMNRLWRLFVNTGVEPDV